MQAVSDILANVLVLRLTNGLCLVARPEFTQVKSSDRRHLSTYL